MMFHLHLLNENTNQVHIIDLEPYDNILGIAWSSLLKEAIDSNNCWLVETDRIYHLNDNWSKQNILSKMQDCINIINNYDIIINTPLNAKQETMNYFHALFVDLIGKDNDLSEWYVNSPKNVQDAVSEFNVLIHRYEAYDSMNNHAKITVGYKNRPTREMTLEEKKCFNLDLRPGEVYLKYCHKGKDILTVFKDKDDHANDENIVPQYIITPDFNINFSRGMKEIRKIQFNNWLDLKKEFFNSIDINIDDPSTTIGRGVVGKVIHNNIDVLKKEIFGVTKIHDITYKE